MGQKEKSVINEILTHLPENERLWRANCGMGWTGKVIRNASKELVLLNARPFHGLPTGFSDLFGLKSVEITPEMIGQRIAIFVGAEIKTGNGRQTMEQKLFQKMLENLGGEHRLIQEG